MRKLCCALLAILMLLSLTACGDVGGMLDEVLKGHPVDGYAEGTIGDTMHTAFFDYTINNAYTCGEYAGNHPYRGYQFLVVDITIKNTFGDTVPMFDTDFTVEWGEGENDYDYPLSHYNEALMSSEELPLEYKMADGETRTGLLIYEVPLGMQDLSISFLEQFEDDTTGDRFSVKFTADDRGGHVGSLDGIYPTDGMAEGGLGDTLCTAFFEYTVHDASLCGEYAGYTPAAGYQLLVANVTVKSTYTYDDNLPMFDTDFQLQWGEGEEDYDYPITFYTGETLSADQLPGEYELAYGESITGLLVYEVPADLTEFALAFEESYSDGTTGDRFFVRFTAGVEA